MPLPQLSCANGSAMILKNGRSLNSDITMSCYKKERLLKDAFEDILKENITFVYASKEEEFNNAVALKEYVEKLFT